METKLELKQRCKELSDCLVLSQGQKASADRDLASARLEIERLNKVIAGHREGLDNWRKVGKRIIYMIAYDLAENRTHRERNEQMRFWIRTLKDAMENLFYGSELDDIPF